MEIWKPTSFKGYSVSNLGRVRADARKVQRSTGGLMDYKERILKPTINHKGYEVVYPSDSSKEKYKTSVQVHRLVAEAFIPNPDNKPQVNHKDANKRNNLPENLEWVTNLENHEHKLENHLYPDTHAPRAVQAVEDGVVVNEFPSLYQAGLWARPDLPTPKSSDKISQVARGKRRTAYGYVWRFVNKVERLDGLLPEKE